MWNTLSAAIAAVVATSDEIDDAAIFEYRKSGFERYPAVTITMADNTAQFADTSRNRRHYVFSIKVYQERPEQSEEEAERILRTTVDDLISKFDADSYLGNALAGRGFAHPIPSNTRLIASEQVDVLMAEILIDCEVIQ